MLWLHLLTLCIISSYIYIFTWSRDSLLKCNRKGSLALLECLQTACYLLVQPFWAMDGPREKSFLWVCNDLLVILLLFPVSTGATHYRSLHLWQEETFACSPWWTGYKSPVPLILTGEMRLSNLKLSMFRGLWWWEVAKRHHFWHWFHGHCRLHVWPGAQK